ncbi:MAG: hypothetical protein A3C79_01955 [Candidatus Taylorbacteria bacterium RIFCSPHIGHO2_02_FULL_45_28]|uniref:Glycosyl transferase family 1 domain-containing protein n=1 Tax=Candidatus Taylorbacteria bacterium RIFCSPHIGHO2_12_FULL_45_16 TaxID=1802315 RepID=A0A1G2N046_9BACT|nr:MAG: hypothetical protein A2830_02760 [Candidatus Taylorbacteria bacterium RIFCSPHIGHO2_01_FULL_44_110]OHA25214.1 MAG: hypothetical protein A3C79_01955 [Candidatus Taylorbacteria bacterium RIFCSPHIGHO2_02_FULL_45_28]OHA29458.1 MAG: hypothetical protein A3F51_00265 [Candidatus Taylorbacteria bacterium RIFCSPHIGHO2_12_FULL_45_16]OHA33220.1 MAG: hypothetical protein A3A23_02795 [Candidatus Taylorbacteria bacterium RIFCSPLOWO2_01_FULL_45_59]
MRLLICTQVIDKTDSSLGFFQKWVSSMSPKFESITVIALKVGVYTLPGNVQVHSLGKESSTGKGRIANRARYVLRFYRFAWGMRKEYDAVFVHMNQEYVLLGGLMWKLLRKKIYMWRNHYKGNVVTDIAATFCYKVFCTSMFSYTAKYKKTVLMPVGVDEDSRRMEEPVERTPRSILFLGRLDASKRPDVLIDALGILAGKGIAFSASFVGGASKTDSSYPDQLRTQVNRLGIDDKVKFIGAVPNTETFRYYRSHVIFVNCSKSGMFDKTIFKAVACGCLVLVTSRDFANLVGPDFIFPDGDSNALAELLTYFLAIDLAERSRLINRLMDCMKCHSLPVLVNRLAEEIIMPHR